MENIKKEIEDATSYLQHALGELFDNRWAIYVRGSGLLKSYYSMTVSVYYVPNGRTDLDHLNSPAQVRLISQFTDKFGRIKPLTNVSFEALTRTYPRDSITFRKITGKTLMDAVKKVEDWFRKWKNSFELNEDMVPMPASDTTTDSIPKGPESVGVKVDPDGTFGDAAVFDCDGPTFSQCIQGKKKYGKWSAYLGKDNETFSKVQNWMSQSRKNSNFMLRNSNTGEMTIARRTHESEDIVDAWYYMEKEVGSTIVEFVKKIKQTIGSPYLSYVNVNGIVYDKYEKSILVKFEFMYKITPNSPPVGHWLNLKIFSFDGKKAESGPVKVTTQSAETKGTFFLTSDTN